MFQPHFAITPAIAKWLMDIEASRQVIATLPLTVTRLDSLRKTARLLSTHYSTQIEGNRLTPTQVEDVLAGGGRFPGRERDETEVKHYYQALEFVEDLARGDRPIGEAAIKTIHSLVMTGKRKMSPYRDGQNVIRDTRSGAIVYMPPEASDVPVLVKELVKWIALESGNGEWPAPIIAALAHYQFATIHPYFDGNGRTARLLTNLILHRSGYGLNGIYSLEEYYAKNLPQYYEALNVGPSHNYYFGRAEADVTKFVAYFSSGMADSFARIRQRAEEEGERHSFDQSPQLRGLNAQQRNAMSLFLKTRLVSAKELAAYFRMSTRSASKLCSQWVDDGFLAIADSSKKKRQYRLTDRFERLIEQRNLDS